MRKIIFFLLVSFLFFNTSGFSQIAGGNLAYLDQYREELPYFQELITGGQYAEASRLIEGDPYYFSRYFENGTLRINGVSYPDVPVMYDEYRDQLVTFHPLFKKKILIKPEKIDGFTLSNGDEFKAFSGNKSYPRHQNGLYQVLGRGEFVALAKCYKTTQVVRELGSFDERFVEKADYFLWKEGIFYPISRAKNAWDILGMKGKDVRKKLRSQRLNFRVAPKAYLAHLVANNGQ